MLLCRNSKIPVLGSTYWITMLKKDKSHTQSLFTHVNWDKTEMEESETEGSAWLVNIGHWWS